MDYSDIERYALELSLANITIASITAYYDKAVNLANGASFGDEKSSCSILRLVEKNLDAVEAPLLPQQFTKWQTLNTVMGPYRVSCRF